MNEFTANPVDVLLEARARLQNFWWDGSEKPRPLGRGDTSHSCIVLALAKAIGNPGETASLAAYMLGFKNSSEAFDWNDAEGRTQEEVLARIDERIAHYSAVAA